MQNIATVHLALCVHRSISFATILLWSMTFELSLIYYSSAHLNMFALHCSPGTYSMACLQSFKMRKWQVNNCDSHRQQRIWFLVEFLVRADGMPCMYSGTPLFYGFITFFFKYTQACITTGSMHRFYVIVIYNSAATDNNYKFSQPLFIFDSGIRRTQRSYSN